MLDNLNKHSLALSTSEEPGRVTKVGGSGLESSVLRPCPSGPYGFIPFIGSLLPTDTLVFGKSLILI